MIQAQNVQALPDSQPPDGTDKDPSIGIGSCVLRIATAFEHLQAMGWNCLDAQWPKTGLLPVLQECSPREIKLLSGNGMHLKVEAAWMMYCLGNTMRREDWDVHRDVSLTTTESDAEMTEMEFEAED